MPSGNLLIERDLTCYRLDHAGERQHCCPYEPPPPFAAIDSCRNHERDDSYPHEGRHYGSEQIVLKLSPKGPRVFRKPLRAELSEPRTEMKTGEQSYD